MDPYDCRPGLFFTGTDTNAGKTFVVAVVARALRQRGEPVRVCKPVATGATLTNGRLVSDDTVRLAEAVEWTGPLEAITPWTFAEPVAPPVAARLHRVKLTLDMLANAVARHRAAESLLLVEGIGGLLCPVTETEMVADLIKLLRLPLVIVARRALGTLNHTLLTLEVAHGRGLKVAGVVVTETTPPSGLAEATNVDELRRRLNVPVLAVVPHQSAGSNIAVPALAEVDWRQLAYREEKGATCRR